MERGSKGTREREGRNKGLKRQGLRDEETKRGIENRRLAARSFLPHPAPRMLSNSDLERGNYATNVRWVGNERSLRHRVSIILLFQVL